MSEVVKTSAGVKAFFNWSIWRFLSIAGYILCKPNLIIGSKQAFAAENLNWVGWEIWLFCKLGSVCRLCAACKCAKCVVAVECILCVGKKLKHEAVDVSGCKSFVEYKIVIVGLGAAMSA